MRRVTGNVVGRMQNKMQAGAPLVARRNLEPISTWWLASWVVGYQYLFMFWYPMLVMDWAMPLFMYDKIPVVHYLEEKRVEAKLRRELDTVYTAWDTNLDSAKIDEALARTF